MNSSIRMIGIALSAVIAFVGILNFINSSITKYCRKREFAILCSIGMTEQQLDASGRKYVLCTDLRRYQPDPWYRAFTDHNDGIEQCDPVLSLSPKLPDICHHAADTGGSGCTGALTGVSADKKESIVERLRNTE